jgi:2,3-bisphosphoglycerate-independent phosphoglycerate mutase
MAETEKYAHVTFFFNGGQENQYAGETRILINSPKVATYDLKPEMSAFEVTQKLIAALESGAFDFIVVNYANADMVGHSGKLQPAIEAAQYLDACLGQVEACILRLDGIMLVTADHGNLEQMKDPLTQEPHTAHTLNPVPAVLISNTGDYRFRETGSLADIAPTLLDLLTIYKPQQMTGKSLLTATPNLKREPS